MKGLINEGKSWRRQKWVSSWIQTRKWALNKRRSSSSIKLTEGRQERGVLMKTHLKVEATGGAPEQCLPFSTRSSLENQEANVGSGSFKQTPLVPKPIGGWSRPWWMPLPPSSGPLLLRPPLLCFPSSSASFSHFPFSFLSSSPSSSSPFPSVFWATRIQTLFLLWGNPCCVH